MLPFKGHQLSGRALSIRRENIKALTWFGSALAIGLEHNTLSLSCRQGYWKQRAKELADLNTRTPVPDVSITPVSSQDRLQQVQDFHALDLLASTQAELNKAVQSDPSLSADPTFVSVGEKLADRRLALRVGAGFLFVNGVILFLATSLLSPTVQSIDRVAIFTATIDFIIRLYAQ